ncbi:MAG: class I SAM-dependent methyltransferase [Aliidongia sp.]
MAEDADWLDRNRTMWDGVTPAHLASPLYDIDGFLSGRLSLQPHEIADLGPVAGRDLIHLQCHIGLDTLSWARLGANVTGLDFSAPALSAARDLATRIGVEARFVEADIYDAPAALQGATYDIVYTGVGALCWLPDMARWARVVHDLLRPGGELYLFEFHPVEWILDAGPSGTPQIFYDYFTPAAGYRAGGAVTYAAPASIESPAETVQWNHPLGEIVTALAATGLRIESLRELDRSVLQGWSGMESTGDGMFRQPATSPSLPLMYVLRASRPALSAHPANA